MTGLYPIRSVLRIFPNKAEQTILKISYKDRSLQVIKVHELQKTLDKNQKYVTDSVSARRDRSIEAHNKATNIISLSFATGDLVLVLRNVECGHKIKFRCFGPCVIKTLHGEIVYGVTPFRAGKSERLKFSILIK